MSYQQAIRNVLLEVASQVRRAPKFQIELARTGNFHMVVTISEGTSRQEQTFDLSNGMTPRTAKSIRDWCRGVLDTSVPAPIHGTSAPAAMHAGGKV